MWGNRNVWIILTGECIAGIGLWMGIIGNLEFMQALVPSDFMKAVILSIGLLAGILVGPFAGKCIDQMNKKTVLLAAGLGRFVSVFFMLIAIELNSIAWMIAFVISIQVASSFYFPALQATIPLIVPEHQLLVMNGWHMNVATISRVAGTALAGLLLVKISLNALYLLSLVAYALLFVFTWMLQLPKDTSTAEERAEQKKKGGFKEIFPILKQYPVVLMTLILTLIPLLFLGSFNLIVIKLSEIQDSQAIKGIVYAIEGIAFMVGTVVIKRLTLYVKTLHILFGFAFIVGIAELFLLYAHVPVITYISFGLLGFALGCFFPTAMLVFQKQMPKQYHGRFFAFRNMLERIMFQVVLLSSGALLDLIGLQAMVVIFGALSMSLTVFFFLKIRKRTYTFESENV